MKFTDIPKSWEWRALKYGIKMPALAQLTGVTLAGLHNAVKGRTVPTLTTVEKVEDILKGAGSCIEINLKEKT